MRKKTENDKNEFNKAGKPNSGDDEYKTPYPKENRIYTAKSSIVILKEKRVSKKLKNSIKRQKIRCKRLERLC